MLPLNEDNHFRSSSVIAKLTQKTTNFCLGGKSYREFEVKQAMNPILTVGFADRLTAHVGSGS